MDGDDITLLLKQWKEGDRSAENKLFELMLPELKRLARRQMADERRNHTLEPTELVQQLYLRWAGKSLPDWQSRKHFFAIAARTMSWYLIEYARQQRPGICVPFEDFPELQIADSRLLDQMVQIGTLLHRLDTEHPVWCSVVELKFFVGMTDEEVSELLDVPVRTVQRYWHDARRWLFEQLTEPTASA